MDDCKKELIESTASEFKNLSPDNKMFVLGYMIGVQKGKTQDEAEEKQSA
ncbi:hypothetical protein [Lacrimispora sp. 210928-DFI.3.58]|nr:hypothetical protein [Lacrimispora sp. 210928-DFI.3.58]MCB7317553.1 hypothetical protein [Lacrimispora sp. 210928-DFI.3.58]